MKVYAIVHNYNNGLSYEDYMEYTTTNLYSTLDEAFHIYKTKISNKYEGNFELIEWEVDTNNKKTLKESPYINCTPYNPYEEDDKNWAYGDNDY